MGQRRLWAEKNLTRIQNQGHGLLNAGKKGSGSQKFIMKWVAGEIWEPNSERYGEQTKCTLARIEPDAELESS